MINKDLTLKHLYILKNRPHMILVKINGYYSYEEYINGIFNCMELIYDLSISRKFSYWVGEYFNDKNTNAHWSSFLKVKLETKPENEKINKLLCLVEEFITQL